MNVKRQTIAKTAALALMIVGSSLLFGCAPMISGAMNATLDENAVTDKTAKHFGLKREEVTIIGVEKGALSTTYRARVAGLLYDCSIYYGDVSCTQPGGDQTTSTNSLQPRNAASASVPATMTVAQAQARLNRLGYPVGSPDGVMGKKSLKQLQSFQRARGLPASGKLDEATIAALGKEGANP